MTEETKGFNLQTTEKMGEFLLCVYENNDPQFCQALNIGNSEDYKSYLHNNLIYEC